mmetsp:Transcript_13330/g.19113  ORF Transcript_13330/g.19113 Transcript_13330/m.19113 type:complete len:223 (+) Transcript_13330:22-690(+)
MPKCNDRYCWFPNGVLTSRYSCAVCGAHLHFDCGIVPGATNRECWQCRKSSNVASSEDKGSKISFSSSIMKRRAEVNSSFGRRDKRNKETKNNNSTATTSTTSTTTEAATVAEQEGSINNNDATGTRNGASNFDQLMGLKTTITTTTSTTTTDAAAVAAFGGPTTNLVNGLEYGSHFPLKRSYCKEFANFETQYSNLPLQIYQSYYQLCCRKSWRDREPPHR